MLYNVYMDNRQQTLRIWTKTLKKLRLIAAITGETMVQILERLVSQEWQRVKDQIEDE